MNASLHLLGALLRITGTNKPIGFGALRTAGMHSVWWMMNARLIYPWVAACLVLHAWAWLLCSLLHIARMILQRSIEHDDQHLQQMPSCIESVWTRRQLQHDADVGLFGPCEVVPSSPYVLIASHNGILPVPPTFHPRVKLGLLGSIVVSNANTYAMSLTKISPRRPFN